MFHRITFAILASFCFATQVWLWRNEFVVEGSGAQVPLLMVWNKILTAPDNSSMEVRRAGDKIGFCRWTPNIGEELATGKVSQDEATPEGMILATSNYTLDVEGNLAPPEWQARYRFHLHIDVGVSNVLRNLEFRVNEKKTFWEVKTLMTEQQVKLSYGEGEPTWSETFRFEDLKNPSKLLGGLPLPIPLLGMAGLLNINFLSSSDTNSSKATVPSSYLGLRWECRQDWLRFRRSRMRVYRLQTRLLDRHSITVFVSRVGEILRAELPGNITLVNEAIANFQ